VLRSFFAPGVLLVVVVTAVLSWVSWVGIGSVCVNATDLHRGSPQGAICEIEQGHWHASAVGGPSFIDALHSYLTLALPLLIVLAGIGLAAARQRQRSARIASVVAGVVLLAPWIGFIVLPR
jgi:hypothetical protein